MSKKLLYKTMFGKSLESTLEAVNLWAKFSGYGEEIQCVKITHGNAWTANITYLCDKETVMEGQWLRILPTVDMRTGDPATPAMVECSICGETNGNNPTAYCPHCGARMKK